MNKQIRYAEKLRVPVICVVGEQEASSGKLSVRARGRGDLGKIDVDVLLDMLDGVEDVDQLDAGAFERPVAPEAPATPDFQIDQIGRELPSIEPTEATRLQHARHRLLCTGTSPPDPPPADLVALHCQLLV